MDESKQSSRGETRPENPNPLARKNKSKKTPSGAKGSSNSGDQDVLLRLPGGFEYKIPSKKQRIALGSVVIGLNLLLVIATVLYFYNTGFHDFIYNVGR